MSGRRRSLAGAGARRDHSGLRDGVTEPATPMPAPLLREGLWANFRETDSGSQ